jgi:hypothetical protein
MKTLMGLILALVLAGQQPVNLAGKWKVVIVEHENLPIVMEIHQDGTRLTADFLIPDHGDLEMAGEIVGSRLTLTSTENSFAQMTMNGRIGEDGTLSGNASGGMGPMTWTATKANPGR